jgi:carboxyl-terminal processing protease
MVMAKGVLANMKMKWVTQVINVIQFIHWNPIAKIVSPGAISHQTCVDYLNQFLYFREVSNGYFYLQVIMKRISLTLTVLLTCGSTFLNAQIKNTSSTTDKFSTLLNYIDMMYVDTVNTSELVEKAIVHMLEELDPHSVYLSKEEVAAANEPLQGSFDGIGVQFQILHDTIQVIEPIQGGPSEKLGIKSGDKIVKIDGENVAGIGIKNSDVMKKLKGPKGTKVTVGIERNRETELLFYTITRDKIPIYSTDASYMAAPGIGYIKISRFAQTTAEEMRKAINELREEGMKDLIIDLQGNGGGLLDIAVEMCDEFIAEDRLLVYTEGRSFPRDERRATPDKKGIFEKGRLIVLIDESSASASEILSGAIQDWDRGLIIGRRSFGKGLVQRPVRLPDGSMVRLTVQKYFTPSGRCIQKSYEDGLDEYEKDKEKRFKNGELFSLDSLNLPDSLKYFTNLQHRTVYGGGGILPDIFVPLDTSENSNYFSEMLRTGVNNDWVMEYTNVNRAALLEKYPTITDFTSRYELPENALSDMINRLTEKKVEYNEKEFKTSEHAIKIRTKALIARNLYDGEAFYVLINELNPAMKKATEVLQDGTFENMKLAYSDFKVGVLPLKKNKKLKTK